CGMALGLTKLPMSMVWKPARSRALRYSTLMSVGMNGWMPCMASRGHSMSLMSVMSTTDVHWTYLNDPPCGGLNLNHGYTPMNTDGCRWVESGTWMFIGPV